MRAPRRRRVRFALTGLGAAALAMLGGAAVVLKSAPATACFQSAWPVTSCGDCSVDGGSSGVESCYLMYAVGQQYCEAFGNACVSD
jgi:hypothetical protein